MYKFFTFWKRQGIPAIPGIVFSWATQPFHEFTIKRWKEFGRIYGGYSINHYILIVNDAKLIRDYSIKENHKFPERFHAHLGTSSIRHSLFMMTANEDWKRIRSIVSPAFTSGKLKSMLTLINHVVDNFIQHLDKQSNSNEKFDIKIYTSAFAMNVIASCAYGINVDSLSSPNHPIVEQVKRILSTDASLEQIICFTAPDLAKFLNLNPFDIKSCQYLDNLTFEIIKKRQEANQKSKFCIDITNLII